MATSGKTPDDEIRDGFKFRGGSLPLDLAATLAARKREHPRELLAAPEDCKRWMIAARLASSELKVTTLDLERARKLRESIYSLALARITGSPFPDADRLLLNRFAAGATPAPRLERNGLRWAKAGAPELLAVVAREAVELLGGPFGDRIRQCSGDGCAILFLDTSRSGHRKWCSMAGCGNKAKVASFRDRNTARKR